MDIMYINKRQFPEPISVKGSRELFLLPISCGGLITQSSQPAIPRKLKHDCVKMQRKSRKIRARG